LVRGLAEKAIPGPRQIGQGVSEIFQSLSTSFQNPKNAFPSAPKPFLGARIVPLSSPGLIFAIRFAQGRGHFVYTDRRLWVPAPEKALIFPPLAPVFRCIDYNTA
jgi:hypothetical protein